MGNKISQHLVTLFFKCIFILFYCYAGWGYSVAFTKVVTMCQIYGTLIHALHW
jgi:hypothetical protein